MSTDVFQISDTVVQRTDRHQIIMLQETFIILDDHKLVCVCLPGSNLNIQAKAIMRYKWQF
jgi:hypothetical protein